VISIYTCNYRKDKHGYFKPQQYVEIKKVAIATFL